MGPVQTIFRREWLFFAAAALFAFMLGASVSEDVAGFIHDDGLYLVTARALGDGQGYTLAHIPTVPPPPQIKYPVLYPVLLGLVGSATALLDLEFPESIPALGWFSALCSLGAFALAFLYLRGPGGVPPLLAASFIFLAFSNYYVLFYASAVMSEGPFLLVTFAGLYLLDRRNTTTDPSIPARSRGILLLVIGLCVAAFHLRMIGLALGAAMGLAYLLRGRLVLAFGAGGIILALTVLPWLLYVRGATAASGPVMETLVARTFAGYDTLFSARQEFLRGGPGVFLEAIGTAAGASFRLLLPFLDQAKQIFPADSAARAWFVRVEMLLGLALFWALGRMIVGGVRDRNSGMSSPAPLFGLLYLALYLTVVIFWNHSAYLGRFIGCVGPLLWLVVYRSLRPTGPRPAPESNSETESNEARISVTRRATRILGIAWLLLALFSNLQHFELLADMRKRDLLSQSRGYEGLFADYRATFAKIKADLPAEAIVGSRQDAALYLYSGRRSYYLGLALTNALGTRGGLPDRAQLQRIQDEIDTLGVTHILVEPLLQSNRVFAAANPLATGLINLKPGAYRLIYRAPGGLISLFEIVRDERKKGP